MRNALKTAVKRLLFRAAETPAEVSIPTDFSKLRLNDNQVFLGYPFTDLAVLAKYMVPNIEGAPGFHVDCFGIRTRYSHFSGADDRQGAQSHLPFPDNTLYGEAIEFLGTALAVDAAGREMVVYELGAGFAPWLVVTAAMARQRPIDRLRLVAVEADPERLPSIRRHFVDNNIPMPGSADPTIETAIVHAAASDKPGTMKFSAQGIKDWGGAATDRETATDYRGVPSTFVSVPSLPISTLIEAEQLVDLVHLDVQGAEYSSVDASIDAINLKVRSMVIGTHSRLIEGQLLALLRQNGWTLVYEKPCKFHASSALPDLTGATYFDGTQFWINNRLWPSDFKWQPDMTPEAVAALRAVSN